MAESEGRRGKMRLRVAVLLTCAPPPPPVNVNFPLTQLPNVILCCHHHHPCRCCCCSSTGRHHCCCCWSCSYPFQDSSSTFYLRCLMNYEAPPTNMMRGGNGERQPLPLLLLQGSNKRFRPEAKGGGERDEEASPAPHLKKNPLVYQPTTLPSPTM